MPAAPHANIHQSSRCTRSRSQNTLKSSTQMGEVFWSQMAFEASVSFIALRKK